MSKNSKETCGTCAHKTEPAPTIPIGKIRCRKIMEANGEDPILYNNVRTGVGLPDSIQDEEKDSCYFKPSQYAHQEEGSLLAAGRRFLLGIRGLTNIFTTSPRNNR